MIARRQLSVVASITLLMGACKYKVDYYCDEDTPCADRYSDRTFCDLEGEYPASEGIGHTCIPDPFVGADAGPVDAGGVDAIPEDAACPPSSASCSGDSLITCDEHGEVGETIQCPLGCNIDACLVLEPSNLETDLCESPGLLDYVAVGTTNQINTTSDCHTTLVQGGDAPDICVMRFANVTVAEDAIVTVYGARALALIATESFTVSGRIHAAGHASEEGPGAPFVPGIGGEGMGGGGGGGGTAGAAGGSGSASPGPMTGTPALIPLVSGSTGGEGGGNGGGGGGGGGGAIQLVSCGHLEIDANGTVHAGGGGGGGGRWVEYGTNGYGGGGGSGGGILIEAASVAVDGVVAANGGGGGGGAWSGSDGVRGQDAECTATAAGGGSIGGGDGGFADTLPTEGGSESGGGGAVGRIRINVRPGTSPTLGGLLSPAPSTGEVVVH